MIIKTEYKCPKCNDDLVEIVKRKQPTLKDKRINPFYKIGRAIRGYFCLKCDEKWINDVIPKEDLL